MRRLVLDARQIPTGEETPFPGLATSLGERTLDDGFVVLDEHPLFAVAGGGRRITIEFLEGYPFAQVYAPSGQDYLAVEPMTAPANALASGHGLRLVGPGGTFRATFRVGVELLQ
jgi:aldose 1-epimerase